MIIWMILWINLDKSTNLCTEYWPHKKLSSKIKKPQNIQRVIKMRESILLLKMVNTKWKERKNAHTQRETTDKLENIENRILFCLVSVRTMCFLSCGNHKHNLVSFICTHIYDRQCIRCALEICLDKMQGAHNMSIVAVHLGSCARVQLIFAHTVHVHVQTVWAGIIFRQLRGPCTILSALCTHCASNVRKTHTYKRRTQWPEISKVNNRHTIEKWCFYSLPVRLISER